MAQTPTKLDRNSRAIGEEVARQLAEQSSGGWFGEGGLRWVVRDGVVVKILPEPKREIRLQEKDE